MEDLGEYEIDYDDETLDEAIENEDTGDDARSDKWEEIGKDLKPLNLPDIRATENVKQVEPEEKKYSRH